MNVGAIVAVVLLTAACSGSNGGSSPSIYGTWDYVSADGATGEAFTANGDDTYVFSVLQLTSSTTANAQTETGTFVLSDNTFTATPKEWSCPSPDPVYSGSYSFQGNDLEIVEPSGIVVFQPDTATASNFSITLGCFSSSGAFTASPLAPVMN